MVWSFFLAILAQTSVCTDERMRENTPEALRYWEKCLRDFISPPTQCFLLSECFLPCRTEVRLSHLQCYTVTHMCTLVNSTHAHSQTAGRTLISARVFPMLKVEAVLKQHDLINLHIFRTEVAANPMPMNGREVAFMCVNLCCLMGRPHPHHHQQQLIKVTY